MVLNICFTNLWVLWEFGLYLYLGNSHVLVAMFDLVYYPGNKQIREMWVDTKDLSSSLFDYKRGCISHILG